MSGPDPRLVGSAAHVYVADVGSPVLDEDDVHHLTRVLRLRDGEAVTACDGRGSWRPCAIRGGALEPFGEIVIVPAPAYEITVALAPPKGERSDWAVQKLTELGVDRIVPLRTERAVVRWDAERAGKQLARWARIAREAAMQSRRVRLPVIDALTDFAVAAAQPGAALCAPDGDPPGPGHRVLLIGPEGGWSEIERTRPLSRVTLGETVLRTETAALAACALAVSARAEFVASGP